MKINDLYEEDEFLTDKDEIFDYMKESFREFIPNRLTIEPDGLIYDGDLIITSHRNMHKLKVKFKEVTGAFYCTDAYLTSLEGCPEIVGGDFSCSASNITTLKYCPQSIGYGFYCKGVKITDPKEYRWALYSEIGGTFNSTYIKINEIINTYGRSANRKYWPYAINLLSKV